MAGVLVFGSVDEGSISAASLEAITVARALSESAGVPLVGALIGSGLDDAAKQFGITEMSRILVADDERLAAYVGELQIAAAEALVQESHTDVVVFPADADAIEWVPALAARLNAPLATNCLAAKFDGGQFLAVRAICGGALRGTYRLAGGLKMLLLQAGLHVPAKAGLDCPVVRVSLPSATARVELLETIPEVRGESPQLKNAKTVVSGGLGVGGADKWNLVEDAARALGAAVGATRAVVEIGWVPPSKQVGFSGLKVAPDLYIAAGISGALHHLAGIAGAKKVVAINVDPDAPIFQAAHIGIVGDVHEVLPAFIKRVQELRT